MSLLVCRTCPRYERDSGAFGAAIDQAIASLAHHRGVRVRHVPCLGGCPDSGNVGLDAMGKPRVRFSGLTPEDADDLVEAAAAYDGCSTGIPGDWTVPTSLARRITAVSPKRVQP